MSEKFPVPDEERKAGLIRGLSNPLYKYGWPAWFVFLLAIIGVIFLHNPTAGILEFLPDNLPFVGNLDETVAVMLVLAGIVEIVEGKKYRKEKKNAAAEGEVEE